MTQLAQFAAMRYVVRPIIVRRNPFFLLVGVGRHELLRYRGVNVTRFWRAIAFLGSNFGVRSRSYRFTQREELSQQVELIAKRNATSTLN